jgi:uncharacterized protein
MELPAYDPALRTPPLDDAELQALDDLLQGLPGEAVMNVEALDGYLTALLLTPGGPAGIAPARWMPVVWGGAGAPGEAGARPAGAASTAAPFASQKQRKRAVVWILRHLQTVDRSLGGPPAQWEPIFSIAEDQGREWVDAEDWCAGFLQAAPLDAAFWGRQFDDAESGPALRPLVLLGGDPAALAPGEEAALASLEQRDALSRKAADAVWALNTRLRLAA